MAVSDFIRSAVSRAAWRVLRIAGIPRYLETMETDTWIQGRVFVLDRYASLRLEDHPPNLGRHEAKVFSQHGEDGILLYIFETIGVETRRFVEIGVEDGRECNTANLAINFGWSGLQVEGDAQKVAAARLFYAAMLPRRPDAVNSVHQWITRENVNATIEGAGTSGPIDLLSIDVDGNDYWIWEAISVVQPRVVVIEYNASFGSGRSITVPYDPGFARWDAHPTGYYHGASLAALAYLGKRKGYSLVGCDSWGGNAFFVRNEERREGLPTLNPEEAYVPLVDRVRKGQDVDEQFRLIEHLPLVTISEAL